MRLSPIAVRRKLIAPPQRPAMARTLAGIGAGWSLLFSAVHFYWAAGGRVGVVASTRSIGTRPGFLAYDISAGVIFLAAATVGCLLAAGQRTRLFLIATLCGALVAFLRGVIGLIQDLFALIKPPHSVDVGAAYDAWFAIAGVIFLLAYQAFRPARSQDS